MYKRQYFLPISTENSKPLSFGVGPFFSGLNIVIREGMHCILKSDVP